MKKKQKNVRTFLINVDPKGFNSFQRKERKLSVTACQIFTPDQDLEANKL